MNVAMLRITAVFAMLFLCLIPASASAQTNQYTNSTTGTINDSTSCATTVTRTFSVGTSYIVSDVDLGVLLSHTYRSDLRITLTSPSGTTVNVMTNVGGDRDNLNVLFDDEAGSNISTHSTNNDTITAVPPYQRTYAPTAALSAFDGQNALGTWTMVICDSVNADTGTFTRADLYLTVQPTNYADLSVTKTVSNASPAVGTSINYTLAVTNAAGSPQTANGVTVLDVLPAGVSFSSASGFGTYSNSTGVWTVGSIPAGTTRTITITVTVTATAGATITNSAEVSASSVPDVDSTPGNGSTTEDDDAAVSFTVSGVRVAGTPPTLICPTGTTTLDWDSTSWTTGSTNGSSAVTNIGNVPLSISTTATWLNNATYGGQSPARQNAVTGGFSPAQFSLFLYPDFSTVSEIVTATYTLPTAVPGAQFRVFDVDYNAGQFADRLQVSGTYNGANVTPTLTNGISNYVIGNSAYGDAGSADTSANGNVVVTFSSPVDTIIISYGNHSLSPANPGGQAIALHDVTFCNPQTTLSVTKLSSVVSDGVSASNPKAIPGAIMRYCILISNSGSATSSNIVATDNIPANVTYIPGSMLSGTNCAGAATAEDDNNSGGDESDPFGMEIAGTALTGRAASLAPGASFAMVFNATVN